MHDTMKINDLFENWKLIGLKVNAFVGEMEWNSSGLDKAAAWDLYIEPLTRIAIQMQSRRIQKLRKPACPG